MPEPDLDKMLIDRLLTRRLVTRENLEAAARLRGRDETLWLGRILINQRFVDEEQLTRVMAEIHQLPMLKIGSRSLRPDAVRLLPPALVYRHGVVPLGERDGAVLIGASPPCAPADMDEILESIYEEIGKPCRLVCLIPSELKQLIAIYFSPPASLKEGTVFDAVIRSRSMMMAAGAMPEWDARLLERLADDGAIDPKERDYILTEHQRIGLCVGWLLDRLGAEASRRALAGLNESLPLPFLLLGAAPIRRMALGRISPAARELYGVIPIDETADHGVKVVLANPSSVYLLNELRRLTRTSITPALTFETDLAEALRRCAGNGQGDYIPPLADRDAPRLSPLPVVSRAVEGLPATVPTRLSLADDALGQSLIAEHLLSTSDMQSALIEADYRGISLGGVLAERNIMRPDELEEFFAARLGVRFAVSLPAEIPESLLAMIGRDFCLEHFLIPVSLEGDRLMVAFGDTGEMTAAEEISQKTHFRVLAVATFENEMRRALREKFGDSLF